ncbi:hypothetical protein [Blastococcus sp. URHD0036]|uniref:hypothetical protein n=1 Tax=Blastococcus sp. URHD0036 TaxID=1380356 RepID=UPI000494E515|nr:hypothetical protein [Blastococcus sp. URHD0036]
MGRARTGPAAAVVLLGGFLLAGCAHVSDADAQTCDYLFSKQDSSLDDDVPALEEIVDRLGPVAEGGTLSTDLRPYVEKVVSDAERLVDGGKARYLDLHVLDALSICMDQGW